MSGVDLREFRNAYVAEAEEQLTIANTKLLEVEASEREKKVNPRAVRELFRALHTIKGLSAMVGVDAIVAISHRMESALRAADRAGGHLGLEAVDVLLKGVRAIEDRVRLLSNEKPVPAPTDALLGALDALESPVRVEATRAAPALDLDPLLASKLAPFEIEALTGPHRDGRRPLRADFVPSPERAARGYSINSVRERVATIAEIVKVIPISVPRTEAAPGGLSFALLLLTSAPASDVAALLGVEAAAISTLTAQVDAPVAPLPVGTAYDSAVEIEDPESRAIVRRGIVRVDVRRLDDAMEQLSGLIVTRSRMQRALTKMTEAGVDTRDLFQIMKDNARQLRDLRAAILRVRMVPASEVLDRIPLIVRGLRRETGKLVQLTIDGGNAELDKAVAERIFPAIVHVVRNAVDHAIESPDERAAAGKPRDATLSISCHAHSNTRLEIVITDDGRGVDRAAVASKIGREVGPTDTALLDAICTPGMSTRAMASTTSGRGMGMDIVKRIITTELGGELALATEPGRGTTFTLRVPLTIAIVDAFVLECATERFVVPVSMVEEIIEIDPQRVRRGPLPRVRTRIGNALIERRGEVVPLLDLAGALDLGAQNSLRQALLVRRNGEPLAFGLERVRGQQEAVVRPLTDPLVQVAGVSGATDLGDGKPTLVLDLVSLGGALRALDAEGGRAA